MDVRDTVGYDPITHQQLLDDFYFVGLLFTLAMVITLIISCVYITYKQKKELKPDDHLEH